MSNDRLTIKIDTATKKELMAFAESVGLTASRTCKTGVKRTSHFDFEQGPSS